MTGAVAAPQPQALTPITFARSKAAKRPLAAGAAVATIFAGDSLGSGFPISPEGYLLTNQHMVGGVKTVKVRWADGSEAIGEVIRSDRRRDVALIKVGPSVRSALALRPTAAVVGETVFAIGTPLQAQLQGTVTKGIVSAVRVMEGMPYIQSDVAVNHGNSGGPLLDESGAVIGITVSGLSISGAPVGINQFIPISDALRVLAVTPAP